jgi:hypothetical protein
MNQLAKRDDGNITDNQLAAGALGAGATMQRIQTPYVTAVSVQKPREFKALAQHAAAEAETMSEDFYYLWEVKERDDRGELRKREICDITHDGALALMRHWGNCAYDPQLQSETDAKWTISVSFVDYEAGITTPRLMQIAKEAPPGKWGRERWDDMVFQKGQSKAIRNAILAGLPGWLKKRCLAAARKAAEKQVDKPNQLELQRNQLIMLAKELGLTGNHLKSKMNGKKVDDYTANDRGRRNERREPNGNRRNGNGRREQPAEKPAPKEEPPKQHQVFAHSMAKAQSIDELESVAQKVGAAHQAGEIDDAERDTLTEVYRSRKAKLTAA